MINWSHSMNLRCILTQRKDIEALEAHQLIIRNFNQQL